jgi:hypothetical protein
MLWRLARTDEYGQRAVDELLNAADYQDWEPQEGDALDLAEITAAMSVGYDWLYDRMGSSERATVRNAILRKGFTPYMDEYANESSRPEGWSGNHDQVIHSCMGVGAMAVKGETNNESLVARVRSRAERDLDSPVGLSSLAAGGGTSEGLAYWGYGWRYLTYFFESTFTAEGAYTPLKDRDGLPVSGYFPQYVTGPTHRTWRFSDCGPEKLSRAMTTCVLWQGKTYNNDHMRWFGNSAYDVAFEGEGRDHAASMLWLRDTGTDQRDALNRDRNFPGAGIASMRSAWEDPRALFVGFKYGPGIDAGHAHLDRGSFVIDGEVHQWAEDLGPDSYELDNYFNNNPDATPGRWHYYRCRAEGHNTLVIAPGGTNPDQKTGAGEKPTVVRASLNPAGGASPFMVADLTPVYRNVDRVRRGVKLHDRNSVIIEDEIIAPNPVTVWWFMHFRYMPDDGDAVWISSDGRTAVISRGTGRRLWLRMQTPLSGAVFTLREARPLPGSPDPAGQEANPSVRKLAISLTTGAGTLKRLTVFAKPLGSGEAPPTDLPEVVGLGGW